MANFDLELLKKFSFTSLFVDLGWDKPAQQQPYAVSVGEEVFNLQVVADKRSVQVLHCQPNAEGRVPEYAIRQKIERKVTSEVREHLIVFTDEAKTIQIQAQAIQAQGGAAYVQLKSIEKWDGKLPQVSGGGTPFVQLPAAAGNK